MIAGPGVTATGAMLFAKNSDRERNEPQALEIHIGSEHGGDEWLNCTYVGLPQARRTRTVLISRPIWGWGAEMGANDAGVVIGNEGLYSVVASAKSAALTGMDLVRLALERAETAVGALEVMIELLEEYGQGGDCGFSNPTYYQNGFMIADWQDAFVLETVGREWMAERANPIRTMSNAYSIKRPERTSKAWGTIVGGELGNNHAAAVTDPDREHIGQAGCRAARAADLLNSNLGTITPQDMIGVLRDHGPRPSQSSWNPGYEFDRSICMHAGPLTRAGQTTGSLVSALAPDKAVHWVTGSSAPCLSLFKPVLLNADSAKIGPAPERTNDDNSLWWRHERFHRAAVQVGLSATIDKIASERDAIEARFFERMAAVHHADREVRSAAVGKCWEDAATVQARWSAILARDAKAVAKHSGSDDYAAAWREMNLRAGLDALLGQA